MATTAKMLIRTDLGYEQVVMGELLIPDTPNSFGDITTKEAIKEFAYEFARQGYGIDLNHDNVDVNKQQIVIVESFIVRPGDPDFIEGSWVIAMKILDDDLWQQVLDGDFNGFSYEAVVEMQPVLIKNLRNRTVTGVTEADPADGHTHDYVAVLDPLNKPISGGTSVTNGHSHTIARHSFTEVSEHHRHRYQVINESTSIGEAHE